MAIKIIQGKPNKKLKVNQGVVVYVKSDGSVQGELLLNEKVIDTSLFSAIIILSEVEDSGNNNN
jgi:hypothetical protein